MGIFGKADGQGGGGLEGEYRAHEGFFALHDAFGDGRERNWDERLDRIDRSLAREERKRQRFWHLGYWQGRSKLWWLWKSILGAVLLFVATVAWLAVTAPLSKSLEPIAPPQITLLAADGTPIARNGAITGEPVNVADLPPHVAQAFLAIEDRRFYDHWGVDPRGIARAAFTGVGGGSTITQQLAKFTFLTPERSLTRKAREVLIAFWLESWLTKDEILSRYLSNAYFGDNVYGLRAASLHYFYRKPENLTLSQAAMLAGLVQAPSRLNPAKHYDRAEDRMRMVLNAMVATGALSERDARSIRSPRLDIRPTRDLPTGTYFADWALPEARKLVGTGYSHATLTTTLDARLQRIASGVVARAPLGSAQVALVAMRPNGEVVAMVGGRDYAKSPFNRASQAQRQTGSTFKLFVYLTALEKGWDPDDTIANTPITEGSYRPKNSNGRYSPELTLAEAFARSSNVAAVRLFNEVGSDAVIKTARDLGVTSDLPKGDPTLALGTSTMTLLELTSAYAGVAANSFPVSARAFPAEEESWFDWLTNGRSSLSSSQHENIELLLRKAINGGTGHAAMLSIPNYGKTGTTQDHRDALFVGYAGDLVVGVWVGNDDNSPLAGVTGGSLPARIWHDFMVRALGKGDAVPSPTPAESADPDGPVQPLDVPDLGDIPLGDGRASIQIRDGRAVLTSEIDGVPVEIELDDQGLRLTTEQIEARRDELIERLMEQRDREQQRRDAEIERAGR